jgi:hypothetical protein
LEGEGEVGGRRDDRIEGMVIGKRMYENGLSLATPNRHQRAKAKTAYLAQQHGHN